MSLFSKDVETEKLNNKNTNDSHHHQQQQTVIQEHYDRQEEYLDAQRAAVEAIQIGRETLEVTEHQAEQLENANNIAIETEYTLDRANRMLRGMTWTGWFQNKFARDIEPPSYGTGSSTNNSNNTNNNLLGPPPMVYENVPDNNNELCYAAVQAMQNYHANIQVLEDCETNEQKETCKLICDTMYKHAKSEVQCLSTTVATTSTTTSNSSPTQKFATKLEQDLATLRQRQLALEQVQNGMATNFPALHSSLAPSVSNNNNNSKNQTNRDLLLLDPNSKSSSSTTTTTTNAAVNVVSQRQEEHLDSMAKHLSELGNLASNINQSLERQSDTLTTLDDKNDTMLFKTKMVNRRTDRLLQNKSWIKHKPEFIHYVSIQHVPTQQYLSVAPNNDSTLVLTSNHNSLTDRCIFGLWKKGGDKNKNNNSNKSTTALYGLQNQYNKRWVGQSLLGYLSCSASTFGRREEWDADEPLSLTTTTSRTAASSNNNNGVWSTTGTALLCTSAGWGTGGYLLVSGSGSDNNGDNTKYLPMIGSGGVEDKKMAPKWIIRTFEKKR